jgi:mannose-1-phosphate guanylyltransferase
MSIRQGHWAIVLAAGDGTRLAALTTDGGGAVVPKQFCSLNGGLSLLQRALERAQRIVPRERVCVIVARQHQNHWSRDLCSLPAQNVIVQPRNCGTANGVLLGLLHVLERDPFARIVFLPADHYVHDEPLLAEYVRAAAKPLTRSPDSTTLVGIEPDNVDPELGYIVPGDPVDDGTRCVTQFVEKPSDVAARALIAGGALWNSFIFWANATTLLTLIRGRLPEIVANMRSALLRHRPGEKSTRAIDELYERLPVIDFSRAVLQGAEPALRVSTAPACGWTDLGTPQRVIQALQRFRLALVPSVNAPPLTAASLDLRASSSSEINLGLRCRERLLITS